MDENRTRWDAVTRAHARSKMYDVPGFLAGKNSLDRFIIDEVGDVRGKKLLHLQCHFGLDTLNWARLGAEVTGVDYSPQAIATARKLGEDAGIEARFVESNVYDLGNRFDSQFDIVFCSWGVLVWLPDLRPWGRLIAAALELRGFFYMAETHPSAGMLDNDRVVRSTSDLVAKYPYFVGEGPVARKPGRSKA
jgi:SAM-dependent methyltransferase